MLELAPGSSDKQFVMLLRSLLPSAGTAGLVLLSSLALSSMHAPPALVLLVPALTALLGGIVLTRSARPIVSLTEADALARAGVAETRVLKLINVAAEMRHDLRGILSPAMLTADRLALSQDPISRRAGEAMISTIERADERLKRPETD
ncbi:MAG: hypothetical protein ACRYGI_15095 [Janthinobacterium lividum]